uniref:THD domain-containing protein n=1 Tax=Oncorhynchus mykiss TaxID=8022 RepID=A0A8C7U4E3_ONCMY
CRPYTETHRLRQHVYTIPCLTVGGTWATRFINVGLERQNPLSSLQQQQVRTNPSAHLTGTIMMPTLFMILLLERPINKTKLKGNVLLVTLPAPASFNNSKREYLEWEDKLGLAHLSDFEYDDGNLIVPKDGVYEVYLQITFRRPSHFVCSKEGPVFILSQRVILFAMNYQNDRELLTASDTVYCSQPPGSEGCMEEDSVVPYWEKSPRTSGVFKLKAGDRLRVSNEDRYHELMLLQEDKTFFGAHLI